MRRSSFALALLVAMVVLVLPQVANAKEGVYSFRVITPSGKVGWVRGTAAKTWWVDYGKQANRGCSCASPDSAARFARNLLNRYSTHLQHWPAALEAWLLVSPNLGSLLYYPPNPHTWGTPIGLVLAPATHSGNGRRWDDWQVASTQMQNILRLALQKGTIITYSGSSAFPTGWALGGGLGAVLLAGLILGAWRRPERVAEHLRHSRYRFSP
jgi:hypothetical protein